VNSNRFDVLIVGAGAAGMLCADLCAENGLRTAVLERNAKPGRKLGITGKGRCNVTNNCTPEDFLQAVRTNPRFMQGAIYRFTPQDTMEFFEECGVSLKTERGARVFPVSDKASEIVGAMFTRARNAGVSFYFDKRVKNIPTSFEDGYRVECEDGTVYCADSVVIATGGCSYPGTGSTGDGYTFARNAGHRIIPPQPSLVPVITAEHWPAECMGLSLRNVTLKVRNTESKKVVFEELGEMLFTHFGVSGPLVLSASSHLDAKSLTNHEFIIDLKPGLTPEKLDERILRDFSERPNVDFHNSLGALLPAKLIPVIVDLCGIPTSQKVNQITRVQRAALVKVIKELTLHPQRFRSLDEAIVTSGGVDVKEVSPKTMESKLSPGLYFIGEVLDVDAYTGGFNLQVAFSTAVACARALTGIK